MADIKRPNYFTSQFLVERDFNDEQAYHLGSRRRHNRVQHTSGVVEGLDVTFVGPTQVQIAPGTAIDRDGREIVVSDPTTYTLVTAGNDLDVFLTLAYQELFDPADHYTQAGLDKFTRTTERPRVQDGTGVPPTDGSVIVLAKIHLNTTGAIESNASIDNTVRVFGGARIPPQAITTAQIADAAVTLGKLAPDAQPTAAQVDNHGGVNQIVAQINAGTGVITRAHLETSVVSGTVTFQSVQVGSEVFSNDIDPGFGAAALSLQLALDDFAGANITSSGDTNYVRPIQLRAEINRATGRFKIFLTRTGVGATPIDLIVRWYAIKAVPANNTTVAVGVAVNPPSATIVGNTPKAFTAAVSNASNQAVTWSIQEGTPTGGTLSATSGTTTTYTPPIVSGPYNLVAISVADPTRKTIVPIGVNADVNVTVNPNNPTVFKGEQKVLTATVLNATNPTVTWSILQGAAGGSLSSTTGASVTYTAPSTPGIYTIKATGDQGKFGLATINVPDVTFSISADEDTVAANHTTTVRATVGGSSNVNARWRSVSSVASVSPALGPTTTFHAPGLGGEFEVEGKSDADPTKIMTVRITVPNVKSPFGEGGGGGGGKFAPVQENLSPFAAVAAVPTQQPGPVSDAPSADASAPVVDAPANAPADAPANAEAKRAFVAPKKRPSTKPSKRADE